jgi:hypothetical protein
MSGVNESKPRRRRRIKTVAEYEQEAPVGPKREETETEPEAAAKKYGMGLQICAGCGDLLYTMPATLIYVARTESNGDTRIHHKGKAAYYCDHCLAGRHSNVKSVIDQIRGPA